MGKTGVRFPCTKKNFPVDIPTRLSHSAQKLIHQPVLSTFHTLNLPIHHNKRHNCLEHPILPPASAGHMNNQEDPLKKKQEESPHPLFSVPLSQPLLSGSQAMLPWQPQRLQLWGQGDREGDTCLHFVSWVIGPAEQGQL